MENTATPAAPIVGSLDPVASQVKTQIAEDPKVTPQAETPAGEANAAPEETEVQDDDQPKTWKEKRQERNRQRWQEYKEAKAVLPQRLASLEAEVARLKGIKTPDYSQITDPTEELAERTAHKVRVAQAQDAEQRLLSERQTAANEQQQKMMAAWSEAVEDAKSRIPDFEQVAFSKDVDIHARMMPFLAESEKGADVAYWLGKNPKEATRIAELFDRGSPQALVEFGRIEARLSAPTPKTLSTAPKPAPTLSGGVNPLQFDATQASVDDFAGVLRKAGLVR